MGGAEKLTVNGCKMHNKMQMNDEMIEKLNIAVFSSIFLLAMLLIWAGLTVTGPLGLIKQSGPQNWRKQTKVKDSCYPEVDRLQTLIIIREHW